MERSFVAIKPDGVQRKLVSEILSRFERRGYKLVALKMLQPTRELLEEHYQEIRAIQDLKSKKFFQDLITYMRSGPIVAMVWEGENVVKQGRAMLGATNPQESVPGTIRGDFTITVGRNIAMERSFVAIKPDGVQRKLVSEILTRFERRGYKLVALKMLQPTRELLEEHYQEIRAIQDLKSKKFFQDLITYMRSGPIVAMVWEGENVVKQGRAMLGATNPQESVPGTIRGDFTITVGRNIVHGSDSVASAQKEIGLWFREEEISSWDSNDHIWLYE
ncbi:nucleoside diphosphate kinase A-like [Symsagittifera roscoffensis]|uniref:nucleoside diphosphate kinase A-like n=1 Tax=Symsagittifera roscoffensis TaxID=84072 RepID=UPI00307C3B87